MGSHRVLLVLCMLFSQSFGSGPPGNIETNFRYSGKLDNQGSVNTGTGKEYSAYYSSKCYSYEGYLNDMFALSYLADPVKDLRITYLSIDLNSHPDEKYYLTVLKTHDAVQRGLLKPIPKTVRIHSEGVRSEIFQTAPDFFENRMISQSDSGRARRYFRRKMEAECRNFDDHNVQVSGPTQDNKEKVSQGTSTERRCLEPEQIRDIQRQTNKLDVNEAPNTLYYKLVLKTNRAVQCNQLTVVKGTLFTGLLGIKTEEYNFDKDYLRWRLPSLKDRKRARTFFRDRQTKMDTSPVEDNKFSKSGRSQSDNDNKVKGTVDSAKVMTYKSSSDGSDGDPGTRNVADTPALTQHPVGLDRHRDVPLYPIKEQGFTTNDPHVTIPVVNTMVHVQSLPSTADRPSSVL